MPDDLNIFSALHRHGVPFVIVGGHAVIFHGYERTTEDVDVVWLRTEASEKNLVAALIEIDAKYLGRDIDPATGIERAYPVTSSFVEAHHLMMLWTKYGFLDLFDYIPGDPATPVEDLFRDAIPHSDYRFASLPWLRKMKQAAGRAKDQVDLDYLRDM